MTYLQPKKLSFATRFELSQMAQENTAAVYLRKLKSVVDNCDFDTQLSDRSATESAGVWFFKCRHFEEVLDADQDNRHSSRSRGGAFQSAALVW